MKQHLTTDELMDRLYGIGDTGHLNECSACSARFDQLCERRAMSAQPDPASQEFMAAQRRTIYARMGERPQESMRWIPAVGAAACLFAVGIFAYHPAQVAKPEVADAQLFSDVYSMEQSMEPVAANPIHALFEQDAQ